MKTRQEMVRKSACRRSILRLTSGTNRTSSLTMVSFPLPNFLMPEVNGLFLRWVMAPWMEVAVVGRLFNVSR